MIYCSVLIVSYPALGLCQIASGLSVRSGSDPRLDFMRWLFSVLGEPEPLTSSVLLPEADSAVELCRSLTEFRSSVRYLKYISL